MVEKSTLFPRTFVGVTSLFEKSTLLPRTFFDVISMVQNSTLFPRTFFDVKFLQPNLSFQKRNYMRWSFSARILNGNCKLKFPTYILIKFPIYISYIYIWLQIRKKFLSIVCNFCSIQQKVVSCTYLTRFIKNRKEFINNFCRCANSSLTEL